MEDSAPGPGIRFQFTAIGTNWTIDTGTPMLETVRQEILELCEDYDKAWSRFRADSLVTQIARSSRGGIYTIPNRDIALLDLYDKLFTATHGALDPLVGRDLELLGYDAEYSLKPDYEALASRVPDSWGRDVHREGSRLITERPVVIDVGAAGKGYLVDLIGRVMRSAAIDAFLVNGSGDLLHSGLEPVAVGLEHPTREGRVIGTVALDNAALCASAINRRTWGQGLHHVLDGRTGQPMSDIVATWAIAADAATADGLSTALFLADPGQLEAFDFSWVRMFADGRVQWSNNFPGELFL